MLPMPLGISLHNWAYSVLGLRADCDHVHIKAAYRHLAFWHHPDRNPNNLTAANRFKDILKAYELIRTPTRRLNYDKFGYLDCDFVRGLFVDTPLSKKFGRLRGRNLCFICYLRLEQACQNTRLCIALVLDRPCAHCKGVGRIKLRTVCAMCHGVGFIKRLKGYFSFEQVCRVCKGIGFSQSSKCLRCECGKRMITVRFKINVFNGVECLSLFEFDRLGEVGTYNARAGQLFVELRWGWHEFYLSLGLDLRCTLIVSELSSRFGGRLSIISLYGNKLSLRLPVFNDAVVQLLNKQGLCHCSGLIGNIFIKLVCARAVFKIDFKFNKLCLLSLFNMNLAVFLANVPINQKSHW